ncbi:DUF7507 domain-containing protein [Methanobacterium sp. ACI-7]|uniref:DUF7507 domain-containing protein n=1 Tax=unclassified Methanobacterium TaxID=2627676 RepID=UPI0039C0F778
MKKIRQQVTLLLITFSLALILCGSASANDLNLTKGSWDTIGLDSNDVTVGPSEYNIQIHVKNNGTDTATNVTANFTWTSSNTNITLANGETAVKNLGDIAPGQTVDVFYLVKINRTSAAYDTFRNYNIAVFGYNTPNRAITGSMYVQKLLSQSRNYVDSITVSNPSPHIGQTFAVTVNSRTASAQYNLVNLPLQYDPTKVQPISYSVTYTNSGGTQTSNNIRIDNPGTTSFTSVWIFRAIGAGTAPFYGIITDQSGQSYHYNDDFGIANVTTNVTPKTDLAISKTVCNCDRTVGQTINYVLTVTNNGPNNATGVIVKDILPVGFSYLYSSPGDNVTYNAVTRLLTWSMGPLNVGSTVVLQIFGTLTQAGTITNTAEVTGTEFDQDTSNNYSTVVVNAIQKTADLGISKTVNKKMPYIGDSVTYTVTVTNDGPNGATGVIVNDSLHAGLQFVSASPSQGTYSFSSGILTWNVGDLDREASATLEIVVRVLQEGTITNTANVTGNEYDPNHTNNQSSETINVQPVANLKITKDVDNREPTPSNSVAKFTLTVQNQGPSNATGVTVIDVLPEGLNFISFVGSPSATYNTTTRTITWLIGNLADSPVILEFNATYQPEIFGFVLNNTATVGSTTFDPDLTNNQATTSIYGKFATLNIQKTVDISKLHVGDTATFTIKLTNNGPDTATGVTITDILPEGFIFDSFVSWTAGSPDISSGTITWNLGDLPNGETVSLVFNATANKVGFWTNIATANSDTDPDPDSSGATVEVLPVADIGVTKTVSNTSPKYDEIITYYITATNYGPNNATRIIIQDILASNRYLAYIEHKASQGTFNPISKIWNVGDLTYPGFATLNITFRVNKTGEINNTATKTFANELDPNTSNDAASVTLNVPKQSGLYLTISTPIECTHLNKTALITFKVGNRGPDAAENVVFTWTIPEGMEFVGLDKDSGNASYDPETRTITWKLGTVPVGDPYLWVTVRMVKSGEYVIRPTLSTTTYDPNLQGNIEFKDICAKEETPETTVKAADSTIPMQPTGLPIGYIALAVIIVLVGLIIPKRK